MIKAVIVDDEALSLELLKYQLKAFENVKVVGSYQNPRHALNEIRSLNPDILITDITMPEMDGLEFAQHVAEILPGTCIVFLTAYDGFAIRAFELGAFDYIMKPVTKERLDKLLRRVTLDITKRKNENKPEPVNRHLKNFITVNKSDSIVVINKSEIIYCCAYNKKTHIYVEEGCFECRHTLEQLENSLEPYFFRCHRSYLVNVHYIREIAPMFNQTYIIRLKNSRVEIPVSRNYAVKIKEFLNF